MGVLDNGTVLNCLMTPMNLYILLSHFINSRFASGEVGEEAEVIFCLFRQAEDGHPHFICKSAVFDDDIFIFDIIFKSSHRRIGQDDFITFIGRVNHDRRFFHCIGQRPTISAGEAAGSQLDSSEVPRHYGPHVGEVLHLQYVKHGMARRALGFSIVSGFFKDPRGTDAPGSFISWLCTQTNVYAWEMPGKRYDIGNLASYEEVKKVFKSVTK